MAATYKTIVTAPDQPAVDAAAITPSDTVDLPGGVCRAIYVGTTGNINLDTVNGTTIVFSNVPVGILPIYAARVRATSTTASNLVAMY